MQIYIILYSKTQCKGVNVHLTTHLWVDSYKYLFIYSLIYVLCCSNNEILKEGVLFYLFHLQGVPGSVGSLGDKGANVSTVVIRVLIKCSDADLDKTLLYVLNSNKMLAECMRM